MAQAYVTHARRNKQDPHGAHRTRSLCADGGAYARRRC
jgi:hypothetical protein